MSHLSVVDVNLVRHDASQADEKWDENAFLVPQEGECSDKQDTWQDND